MKDPKLKLHKVSSLQSVTSPKEAEMDLSEGPQYSMPTSRDDQLQKAAHRALLHVSAEHVSLGCSSLELHNHLEPQGSNMSDLLKIRQVQTEL